MLDEGHSHRHLDDDLGRPLFFERDRVRRRRDLRRARAKAATERVRPLERYKHDLAGWVAAFVPGFDPADYQLETFEAIGPGGKVTIRGPRGLGKCIAYNELMMLFDGSRVEARELIGRHFVLTAVDPETGEQRPTVAWAADNGEQPVIRLRTKQGREVTRTHEHPLWVGRKTVTGKSKATRYMARPTTKARGWTPLAEIEVGDLVLVPDKITVDARCEYDDDLVRLMGYLIADGALVSAVGFSQKPGPVLDDFTRICEALGTVVKKQPGDNVDYRVIIPGNAGFSGGDTTKRNPVAQLCREWGIMGKGARLKRIPDLAWRMPDAQIALLLNAIWACDGYIYQRDKIDPDTGRRRSAEAGITLANEPLIRDIELLLLRLGVKTNIRHRLVGYGTDKRFDAWELVVRSAGNVLRFLDVVGPPLGKEEAAAWARISESKKCSPNTTPMGFLPWQTHDCPPGYHWEPVTSLERLEPEPTVSVEIADPSHAFVTTVVEHNTAIAALTIIWVAVTRDALGIEWKGVASAGSWAQIRAYLFPEIRRWVRVIRWEAMGVDQWRADHELLRTEIQLEYGALTSASPTNSDLIEGAHVGPGGTILILLDEAKSISQAVFDSIEGSLSNVDDIDLYVLAVSTPGHPSGPFHSIHARRPGTEDWWVRHVTLEETIAAGRVSPGWAERLALLWGVESSLYLQHVLGQFAGDDSESLIQIAWVEQAVARWHERVASGWVAPPVSGFGLDVARHGGDRTVVATGCGPDWVQSVEALPRQDTQATTVHAARLLRANPGAELTVDADGMGVGVHDQLSSGLGLRSRAFFGAVGVPDWRDRTGELGAVNARSAAWWHLRDLLDPLANPTLCLPPDDELMGDLTGPVWSLDAHGRVKVEPKERTKARLGRSPDRGDSVCYLKAPSFETPPARSWVPDGNWSGGDWSARPDVVGAGRGGGPGVGRW